MYFNIPLSDGLLFEGSPVGLQIKFLPSGASAGDLRGDKCDELLRALIAITQSSLIDTKKILANKFGIGSDD